MSQTNPSITAASLLMTVSPQTLSPLSEALNVKLPINFGAVANLQVINGSFTPANNSKVIVTGLSTTSPDFILLICDGPAVVSTDNSMLANCAMNKVLMITMPPIVGGPNPINSITLDGHTSQSYPMPQGVALNYTLVIAQAVIT